MTDCLKYVDQGAAKCHPLALTSGWERRAEIVRRNACNPRYRILRVQRGNPGRQVRVCFLSAERPEKRRGHSLCELRASPRCALLARVQRTAQSVPAVTTRTEVIA